MNIFLKSKLLGDSSPRDWTYERVNSKDQGKTGKR